MARKIRNLLLLFGDQLSSGFEPLRALDRSRDGVLMIEAEHEITRLPMHKFKIVFFLSAMRHFRNGLILKGYTVFYHSIPQNQSRRNETFADVLTGNLKTLHPENLWIIRPGEYRVLDEVTRTAKQNGCPVKMWEDDHFYYSPHRFEEYESGKKQLLMERFYHKIRRENSILMRDAEHPVADTWNLDKQNRKSFREAPGEIRPPQAFAPDEITREVIEFVNNRYGNHPGDASLFDLPVTHTEAQVWLRDFVKYRLGDFGTYEDAMWTGQPFLFHSRLSCVLNVKLLSPRDVIRKIEEAWNRKEAPLNSVEGFIRQIVGWREFMRGVYWQHMPSYAQLNHFGAHEKIPPFFWTGETQMNCVHQTMQSILRYGYAHHIQRLMVMGLFSLLWGCDPYEFHQWHMTFFVDAIDWVSLPNTLGMSQFGDGGIIATKPYAASGKYINRMSNYCSGCRYSPDEKTGGKACPFTTLYYDFLNRHRSEFAHIGRMKLQLSNVSRKGGEEMREMEKRAGWLRKHAGEV